MNVRENLSSRVEHIAVQSRAYPWRFKLPLGRDVRECPAFIHHPTSEIAAIVADISRAYVILTFLHDQEESVQVLQLFFRGSVGMALQMPGSALAVNAIAFAGLVVDRVGPEDLSGSTSPVPKQ